VRVVPSPDVSNEVEQIRAPEMGPVSPRATRPEDPESVRPVRVVLQQVALPKYRVPVFRALAERPGIDFTLVYSTYPGLPNVEPQGFKVVCVPLHRWVVLGQEFTWHEGQFRFVSRTHADVVILSWSTRYLSLIPGLIRARLLGIPAIVWGHGFSKHERRWAFLSRKLVARLASAVVFYGNTAAQRFIASGFDRRRVFVALNSLDQAPISASRDSWLNDPSSLAAFQTDKNIAGRDCVIFVSRLDPANRVPLLVEAAAKLRERLPNLLVLIVGSGEDGERLKAMVAEHRLEDHVRLLGSIYDEREVGAYYCSSKVFCYPRNIGLSILHAFGYGLPVVTGDDLPSHNPEIESFKDGENGLFFEDENAQSLADTLEKILRDKPLRARFALGARRTIEERWSLEKMVDGFEAAIRFCTK
jgi:glycosyltransferase involved in cell wall biosynthesis